MEINKLTNLLLLLFITIAAISCNKDGNETIVLEFGNPQKLIIGSWVITNCQKIYKDGRTETADNNVWRNRVLTFSDNGTYTDSQKQGQTFNWKLTGYKEGEPFTGGIYLEDIICDIISLTTGKWIIQMPGEDNYDWLYEMDKEGSPSGNEGSTVNPPVITNGLISQIIATTHYNFGDISTDNYKFSYDNEKRIKNFTVNNNSYFYEYSLNQINVSGSSNLIAYTDKNGNIIKVLNPNNKELLKVSYDINGYLKKINEQTCEYEGTNIIQYAPFTFSYNLSETNDSNIDLNCLVSLLSSFETYSNYPVFSPFVFFGCRCINSIAEDTGLDYDMIYTYTYQRDNYGKINQIIRQAVNKYNINEVLNTTTFVIYY